MAQDAFFRDRSISVRGKAKGSYLGARCACKGISRVLTLNPRHRGSVTSAARVHVAINDVRSDTSFLFASPCFRKSIICASASAARVIYRRPGCICEYVYRDGISSLQTIRAAQRCHLYVSQPTFPREVDYMIELSPRARARDNRGMKAYWKGCAPGRAVRRTKLVKPVRDARLHP